jgi:hypothetical protein
MNKIKLLSTVAFGAVAVAGLSFGLVACSSDTESKYSTDVTKAAKTAVTAEKATAFLATTGLTADNAGAKNLASALNKLLGTTYTPADAVTLEAAVTLPVLTAGAKTFEIPSFVLVNGTKKTTFAKTTITIA